MRRQLVKMSTICKIYHFSIDTICRGIRSQVHTPILFFLHNESGIPMAHRMNDEKWQFDERGDQPYAVADTVGDLFALGLPLLWV